MPKSAAKTRTLHLADGGEVEIPEGIDNVVGIDAEGRIVCDPFDAFNSPDPDHDGAPSVFGLTLCCNAYDKGCEDGVFCRACYGSKRGADEGMYYFRYRDGTWPAEVRWAAGVPFLTKLASPAAVPESHPIAFIATLPAAPAAATPKRSTTVKKTAAAKSAPAPAARGKSAAAQFEALGIPEADWTDAMNLAVKQRWSSLPVDEKVGDLRARLAAVVEAPLPSVAEVAAEQTGSPVVDAATLVASVLEAATDELARRKRNAKVQTWRQRKQLQAAIDARDLKFKALRTAGTKAASKARKSETGDAPMAAAS